MAKHFAGWMLGILYTHPAPYGMGHVMREYQNISSVACTFQYTNKLLHLFIVESIIVFAKCLCPLTVHETLSKIEDCLELSILQEELELA